MHLREALNNAPLGHFAKFQTEHFEYRQAPIEYPINFITAKAVQGLNCDFMLDKKGAAVYLLSPYAMQQLDRVLTSNSFSIERFEVLKKMQADHFWYAGRRRMLANALVSQRRTRVALAVDLGCGPGVQLENWYEYAEQVIGLDQHADQVDASMFDQRTQIISGNVCDLPFEDNSVDLVFALDVLEHVPDEAVLAETMRVLKPGGVLLLSVPAFQWLWSYRDEAAGHLRRYSKTRIRQVVQQSGLQVCRVRYYQFFLFPLVLISRILGQKSRRTRDMEDFPPRLVNAVFRAINMFESRLDGMGLSLPIGSSLIVMARKA